MAKLSKEAHSRDNVIGIQGALKAASGYIDKNLLQDEIVKKVEELLVNKSDLHKACHADYRTFLKAVKDKGSYTGWHPQTLQILNGNKPDASNVRTLQPLPRLDHKLVLESNLLISDNALVKKANNSELELILADIRKLNRNNPLIVELAAKGGILEQQYELAEQAAYNDSAVFRQGLPINKWDRDAIFKWSKAIRTHSEVASNIKILPEMLAVVARAINLNAGYEPRDVQKVSVLMMSIEGIKGKLEQIATGEGKSATTAMGAAINVLRGKKSDVMTSSSVLAKRDSEEWQSFYNLLNISSGHNIIDDYRDGPKGCYTKDIVYGDTLHFQSDLLRDEHKLLGTRAGRKFTDSVVFIDEVDSMLIDESGKIAKLATPIAGMEYLAPIFVAAFHYLKQMIHYFSEEASQGGEDLNSQMPWIQENLGQYIRKLVGADSSIDGVEKLIVPPHLQLFAEEQAFIWAKSAIQALTMSEKRDYLIVESNGKRVIAPVDYAGTGVIQERTNWMNGLHQFLQIKEGLAMSAEGLTSCFISNIAYFKRYEGRIYGMSGTLGSRVEQELLKNVYDVDLAFIPTFKPKRFTELPGIVADSEKEWHRSIAESVKEQTANRRAVLILAETIEDVEKIAGVLIEAGINSQKIRTYTTGSVTEAQQVLENRAMIGDIIVATNIAGRGTDIKTSKAVEAAGGLHVCLTFLPSNLRVEEQAFGRTARQGNLGSGQLIVNGAYEALKLFNVTGSETDLSGGNEINLLKQRRDQAEVLRINDIEKRLLPKIQLEDQLFQGFSRLSHAMKATEDNSNKLRQLEEHWGVWFKRISNLLDKKDQGHVDHNEVLQQFESFTSDMKARYTDGHRIMLNQAYLTGEAINKLGEHGGYGASIDLLNKSVSLAGDYGFAAHYNLAYASFRQNGVKPTKNNMPQIENGITHLSSAVMQLEGVIIPQLHMMQILLGEERNNSDLSRQISTKLNLHKLQSEYIKKALTTIEQGLSQQKIIVVNNGGTKPIFEILGQSQSAVSEEMLEFARHGSVQLFTLEARKPPKDILGAIGVGLLGIAQVVVGALVTVCSGGAAVALGSSMLLSGAQDLYKSTRVAIGKESVNWQDYWLNKGISYAVSIVAMGWENFKAGLSAVKEQTGKILTASKSFFSSTTSGLMGKEAAAQLTTSSLQEGSKVTFTGIAREFIAKEGMSVVALELGKTIAAQNLTNVVAKEITKNLSGTKENIREDAYNRVMQTLSTDPVATCLNRLIAMDKISGSNHHSAQVRKAAAELLAPKINRITQLARQISTAAITGMAARSGNVVAAVGMKVATTGFGMLEAAIEIKELLGEFCSDLRTEIIKIEQAANEKLPEVMHGKMAGQFLDKGDINSIIEILRMNQVLPRDNMQFNGALLQPSTTFVSGIDQPSASLRVVANMPSAQEIKKLELEDLKRKSTNGAKNIEEIDFGPYRRNRGAIIKTARELEQHQSHDYAAERQELAEELAGKVTDRTMGIIRHSIIAPVAMPAVNFCVDTLSGHLMSLGSKDSSEAPSVAAGDGDGKKSLFNKWLDRREEDKALKIAREAASNLSDDELKARAEEVMGGKGYIAFGEIVLNTEGKALVQEYQSRFKEEIAKRHIEAVGNVLDFARGGDAIKYALEKTTGEKVGSISVEPTAPIGSRLAAEGKALKVKDTKSNLKQWFLPSGKPVKLGDINWNHKRTDGPPEFIGRTNREAGRAGHPPQLADGSFVVVGKAHDDLAIASPGAGKANSLDTTPHSARVKALDVENVQKIKVQDSFVLIPKLPNKVAATFDKGKYTARVLEKDMILYRAGSKNAPLGQYFSKDKPISEVQVRINKALPHVWGDGTVSNIDTVFKVKVPAGTVIYTGRVGYQTGSFVGQTQQIVIPKKLQKNIQILEAIPIKK